jgi:8-oxo-dGTP pyrophosphatase MutT (NUDIX family)
MMHYSAGVIPVRKNEDGDWEFLMLRSYGYWDFPKGRIEKDEEPLEAALRELNEESGITDVDFVWAYEYIETKPYRTKVDGKSAKKITRYYIGEYREGVVSIKPNPVTGRVEHEEFRWLAYPEISTDIKLTPRISDIVTWARGIIL